MANVALKNINKFFGKVQVLFDINLDIKEGEFLVLVGPSGCGKSTTLRLVAGLEHIDQGEVFIGDRLVNSIEPQNRNIAMVFQNYALYPHKNVEENIIFGLKRAKVEKSVIEERLKSVAEVLQLEAYLDRKPAQLSGGQRQRVAMGRAIVRDADVFLFDEPLSNLDAKLRNQMRSEIRRIHKTYKTTSIYVTHDQVEAMTLGDRVVVMKDGFIEQCGTPMEIYLNPVNMFVASFIGAPSMNMLDATLFKDHLELEGQKLPLVGGIEESGIAVPEGGKKVKMGIRPDFLLDEKLAGESKSLVKIENCKIELMEPLGFDKELNLQLGAQFFKARLDLRTMCEEGESINLCFDTKRVHLFDIETGKNLALP